MDNSETAVFKSAGVPSVNMAYMRGYAYKALLLLAVALAGMSCSNMVQVKIDVVDQRTALENQVLGSYREINGDLLLLASVRSIDRQGRLVPSPPMPEGRKKALRAMQRSAFNKDDIDAFKSEGVLGESLDGYLYYFKTPGMKTDPKQAKFAWSLRTEENEDRKVLYKRIVEINENFKESDLKKVETIMAGLNRDAAKPGELIQTDSGEWVKKEGK